MTSSILDWSTTAASNATADADINWQENQSPDTVNDSSRTMMARVAEWIKDSTPQRTSTGAADVYTVTSTSSPSALVDGFQIAFKAHQSNTGASTLAVNSFGAKPLRSRTGVALTANEILSGAAITAQYNSAADEFLLIGGRVGNSSADTLARIIPVGFVAPWPTATAPAGWLLAYGQAVSRTTYAELFAAYGTTYGSGDGSTTFNLPDYRGRTPFGKDDMGGSAAGRITFAASGVDGATLGATGGDQKHTLTSAQIPAHTHTATVSITSTPNTSIVENGNSGTIDVTSGSGNTVAKRSNVPNTISSTGTVTVNNTGGGGAHNNMPPAIIQNWIILALPAAASAANLGVNGYYYQWSTTTTDTDPGTGKLGFNNSTLASATQLYISESDQLGNGMAPILATWDNSTSSTKGTLYVYKVGQLSTFAVFTISSTITDGGAYDKFTVAHVASNGTFSDGDQLAVLFTAVGDKGDPGPGIDWQGSWLTATSYALADGVKNGGSSYICTSAHTSGATTEPGVGASWATVWDVIAEKGASGSGTGDMVAANNLSDVANAATSFNNIKQAASETVTGVVELATTAEATTGTDTGRAVTPAGLKAHVDARNATTAASTITDNRIVRGDGGSRGVQESAVTIDDSGNLSGIGTLGTSGVATIGTTAATAVKVDPSGFIELPEVAAPSTPASGFLRLYAKSDGKSYQKNDAGTETDLSATGGGSGGITIPQGRLTLVTATPVMTTTQSAKTTIYYTPYVGNVVPLYNGSSWDNTTFTGTSQLLSDTTKSPAAAGTFNSGSATNVPACYDLFGWSDGGTVRVTRGPAWTYGTSGTAIISTASPAVVTWNSHGLVEGAPVVLTGSTLPTGLSANTVYYVTRSPSTNTFTLSTSLANAAAGTTVGGGGSSSGTQTVTNYTGSTSNASPRGTGAGTSELEYVNGILVNKYDITNGPAAQRGTYLGTIYTNTTSTCDWTYGSGAAGGGTGTHGVWNAYQRVNVSGLVSNTNSSWSWGTNSFRPAEQNVAFRLNVVTGLALESMRTDYFTTVSGAAGSANAEIAIGLNVTNAASGVYSYNQIAHTPHAAHYAGVPPIGLSYFQAVERAPSSVSITIFGGSNRGITYTFRA